MRNNLLDQIIDDKLKELKEEKYKLRTFQTELLIRIESEYGVEETLQDIRSLGGVTVVTALDSLFRKDSPSKKRKITTLEENERVHILKALEFTNWKVSGEKGAAKLLGIKRTTLEARMKKLLIIRPN